MNTRTTLFAIAVLVAATGVATAQPSAAPPAQQPATTPYAQPAAPPPAPPPQQPYAPPAPAPQAPPAQPYAAPQPAPAEPSPARALLNRFTFGFQLVTGESNSDTPNLDGDGLGGWGVFVRFSLNQRWELELETRKLTIGVPGGDRVLRPINLSALIHVADFSGIDVYGRFGVGRGDETIPNNTRELTPWHLHAGGGAQYQIWNNIGIGLEARAERVSRSEPEERISTGFQLGLVGTYHF